MAWLRSCGIAAFVCLGSVPAWAKPPVLPLTRVRLYETGVGYFQRTGRIGAEAVSLPVPASHLDDALKTLVVFSGAGGSSVNGVEFGSSVSRSMARALAGLGGGDQPLGMTALLQSLKGGSVELRVGSELLSGRLVDVLDAETSDLTECARAVDATPAAPCSAQKQPVVVLLTRSGELRRIKLSDLTSARPTDPAFAARLGAALDALSDGSARLMKELRVAAEAGQSLSLGYVSETPVWRASYRLVLPDTNDEKAALQGWALIHNDTDEAWQKVTVDLVNGRPDSFLFPLAAPRYARRELVTPANPLSTVPQLMRTTPDALWNTDDESVTGMGLSGYGEGGGGRGEGIGLGSIGTIGHGAGSGDGESSLLAVGNLASIAPAEAVEAGALFRYTLSQPLDLRAHGSALVPFFSARASARRVVIFPSESSEARSGIYLANDANTTLPDGTLAVFSDNGFAGEAALPRLKTGETATVEFGFDLDVALTQSGSFIDEPKQYRFEADGLTEHYVRHHSLVNHLENRSNTAREVFLGLHYVNNADVRLADALVFSTAKSQIFATFKLARRETIDRPLEVDEGLTRKLAMASLTKSRLLTLAEATSIPAAQKKLLLEAAAHLANADARRAQLATRRSELQQGEAEVQRFRDHARALGAAGEAMIERLLAAEDRAARLRHAIRKLEAESAGFARQAIRTLRKLGS